MNQTARTRNAATEKMGTHKAFCSVGVEEEVAQDSQNHEGNAAQDKPLSQRGEPTHAALAHPCLPAGRSGRSVANWIEASRTLNVSSGLAITQEYWHAF